MKNTESPAAWTHHDLAANPHTAADKAKRVERMFSAIAPSYDLNNRLHSLWRDQAWRRAAVSIAKPCSTDVVLDVACGTGDLAMAFGAAEPKGVIGVDFTVNMLRIAQAKQNVAKPTTQYQAGDALRLPIADGSVDIVSIAFGIRNVTDPAAAMKEFYRVLRPGGRVIILEFSLPANPILRWGYNFYFRHVLPRTASLIARDRSGAYKYLPRSVNTFIGRQDMIELMSDVGLVDTTCKPLTFGVAVCYRGIKPL